MSLKKKIFIEIYPKENKNQNKESTKDKTGSKKSIKKIFKTIVNITAGSGLFDDQYIFQDIDNDYYFEKGK